jgi:hypothetical protein
MTAGSSLAPTAFMARLIVLIASCSGMYPELAHLVRVRCLPAAWLVGYLAGRTAECSGQARCRAGNPEL